jgi:hypothetical protein
VWQIHEGTMRYTLENSPEPVGLEYVRRDANGLIHSPGVFSLMTIDRSKSYDPKAVDTIGMYVNDSADVRVTAGKFKNAVNFRSSKPYIDRSIYVAGVGMIYRETSNSHMKLLYAQIGGKVYGRLP